MYVVSLNYLRPLAELDVHLAAHRTWLDQHYASNTFLASGAKVPRSGGVILVRAIPRERLDALLASDPFNVAGLVSHEIIEFNPTKQHPTLEVTGLLETPLG